MRTLLPFLALLYLAGCTADISRPVEFSEVASGGAGAPSAEELAIIINSQQEWEDLWMDFFQASSVEVPLEGVNFENETVFAAFLGEKSSGGYLVKIVGIAESRDQARVRIEAISPAPGSMVTQAFTTPYHVVKTKKITKPAAFSWERSER